MAWGTSLKPNARFPSILGDSLHRNLPRLRGEAPVRLWRRVAVKRLALGIKCDFGCHPRVNGSGLAGVVDDMADFAKIAQSHRDHVVELHARGLRHFYGPGQHNVRTQKYTIDPEAPGLMAGHSIRYFIGSPAVGAGRAGIAGLIRRIVGDLGLVEISSSVISIPKHLKLLVMFHKQTVDGDVLPVDDETVALVLLDQPTPEP
jgi:hypothetical protein